MSSAVWVLVGVLVYGWWCMPMFWKHVKSRNVVILQWSRMWKGNIIKDNVVTLKRPRTGEERLSSSLHTLDNRGATVEVCGSSKGCDDWCITEYGGETVWCGNWLLINRVRQGRDEAWLTHSCYGSGFGLMDSLILRKMGNFARESILCNIWSQEEERMKQVGVLSP